MGVGVGMGVAVAVAVSERRKDGGWWTSGAPRGAPDLDARLAHTVRLCGVGHYRLRGSHRKVGLA